MDSDIIWAIMIFAFWSFSKLAKKLNQAHKKEGTQGNNVLIETPLNSHDLDEAVEASMEQVSLEEPLSKCQVARTHNGKNLSPKELAGQPLGRVHRKGASIANNLREAFIFKEILDKPRALRRYPHR